MARKNATASWIAAVILVAAVVAAGGYLVHRALHPPAAVPPAASSADAAGAASTAAAPAASATRGPASASTAVLPALADSDGEVAAALAALAGSDRLGDVLVSRQIIARLVATIDALPRHAGLGPNVLPAHPPRGTFAVTTTAEGTFMAAENAARYAPYMAIVEHVDADALVAWYRRAYPLFQQAYRELGYPDGQFNARLIAVIDDLLATPQRTQPAALKPSEAYYGYVDPALEGLSTGQKLLLRTGPANAAVIKAKLRAIRAALVAPAR